MATSPETIAKVRNLLRKLDTSIDQARDKRLHAPAAPEPVPTTPSPAPRNQLIGANTKDAPLIAPPAAGTSGNSGSQRARPLASRMEGPSRLTQPPRSIAS